MIGKTLAHYEITAKLGRGGMGEVYRARDNKLNRDVALKVLPADMASDSDRRKRFEREAQSVAALKHPNIVTIYSVESAGDTQFLTMELVEGETLDEFIPGEGFSLDRFFELAIPLADAVAAAHAKGITHRDLKPANVMMDADGRLKVLDFGLAKLVDPESGADDATMVKDATATAEGKILGTAAYMSPEQAEGKPIDHRSDIFSLGIILYEMATGERPFKGDTAMSVLGAIMKDTPSSITEIKHRFPRALERIIHNCLTKDPDRRSQSVIDIRNQLETFKAEVDSGEAERLPSRGSRVGMPKLVGAVGVLALLAATVVFGPQLFRGPPGEDVARIDLASASIGVIGFENLTNPEDPDHLGRMLTGLITTDLAESQTLSVVTTPRILSALRKAGGGSQNSFDAAVAGEAASLAGAEVMLVGQIFQDGDRILLTAELAQVESGNTLGSLKKEAASRADLFALAGGIAEEVRDKLGVGKAAVEAAPAVDLTTMLTGSPQAYRHYALGEAALHGQEWEDALRHFDQSVREDSTFAMAYYRKAMATWWTASEGEVLAVLKSGAPHTGRLPEHRQLLYRGATEYFEGREHDAYQTLTKLVETPMETPDALYLLGELCWHSRPYQDRGRGKEYFERTFDLDPTFTIVLYHLIEAYVLSEDLPAAERVIARCRVESPGDPILGLSEMNILLARGEYDEVIIRGERLRAGGSTGGDEYLLKALLHAGERERALALAEEMAARQKNHRAQLGETQVACGRIKDGLETFMNHAQDIPADRGISLREPNAYLRASNILMLMGDRDGAIEMLEASIELVPENFPSYFWLALALLQEGRGTEADSTLVNMERKTTELESQWGAYWVDLSRAQVHLWRGEIAEADAAVAVAVSHPSIYREIRADQFVQGKILDAKGDAAGAARAYAEVWHTTATADWSGSTSPILSIYLRAKAEEQGNAAAARDHYEQFLHYWGDADIPIPEVDDAKKCLQALEAADIGHD
jgi:serine/threonine protein kinase/tetratricopeptide (TPR) repeat protein